MISEIKTIADVQTFFNQLLSEELNFHPDNDMADYISDKGLQTYTQDEAELRNTLMEQCFNVCEKLDVDIYDIAMELMLVYTGMDKFIPLPSLQG